MKESAMLTVIILRKKITLALIEVNDRSIINKTYINLPSGSTVFQVLNILRGSIENILKIYPSVERIGCSASAPFNYQIGIGYFNDEDKTATLWPINIKQFLQDKIGTQVELQFSNPAYCYLKGAQTNGHIPIEGNIAAFTLDNSFGSALSLRGNLEDANFWNHPFKGTTCNDYFSKQWLIKRYKEITNNELGTITDITKTNQNNALEILFEEFACNFVLFITEIQKVKKLTHIILGGQHAIVWGNSLQSIKSKLSVLHIDLDIQVFGSEDENILFGAVAI